MSRTNSTNDKSWGSLRLPLQVDAVRLKDEVLRLPTDMWGINGRTAPAFAGTQAIFLRGFAAAEGKPEIEDREALDLLPYIKELIHHTIPAIPKRCVLSRMPGGTRVGLHIDIGAYFASTLRVHFPVITNDNVIMYFGSKCYKMKPGEVWLVNNCETHGVMNAHEHEPRIHLICDYLPNPSFDQMIRVADANQGWVSPGIEEKLGKQ